MKTIIKTSILGNNNIEVNSTVLEVHDQLEQKGNFLFITGIRNNKQYYYSIRKSSIKMVKSQ